MFLFSKKKVVLPEDFYNFPVYNHGKVKKGPIFRETKDYKRITYYVKEINGFDQELISKGFIKMSDVKYENNFNYVIIEPIKRYYKIAYHKRTNFYNNVNDYSYNNPSSF